MSVTTEQSWGVPVERDAQGAFVTLGPLDSAHAAVAVELPAPLMLRIGGIATQPVPAFEIGARRVAVLAVAIASGLDETDAALLARARGGLRERGRLDLPPSPMDWVVEPVLETSLPSLAYVMGLIALVDPAAVDSGG